MADFFSSTRDDRRERIVAAGNSVRQALQDLLSEYMENAGTKPTEMLDEAIHRMLDKTRNLRKQLRKAVVDHVSDGFLEPGNPLLMLIEAAKGGHTNVVSVLIDYNPTTLTPAEGGGAPPEEEGVADEATTTRLPAEGTESKTVTSSSQTPSTTAVTDGWLS